MSTSASHVSFARFTEWAKATGVPKSTMHHRVMSRGMTTAEAVAMGRPSYRKRGSTKAAAPAANL